MVALIIHILKTSGHKKRFWHAQIPIANTFQNIIYYSLLQRININSENLLSVSLQRCGANIFPLKNLKKLKFIHVLEAFSN